VLVVVRTIRENDLLASCLELLGLQEELTTHSILRTDTEQATTRFEMLLIGTSLSLKEDRS
jgi:hypothetical protein